MLRPYEEGDADDAYTVYRDAARYGSQPHYSAEQGRAWAPSDTPEPWFSERLISGRTWVWCDRRAVAGFITLKEPDHLDMFFVRPDLRGGPAAKTLYAVFETEARAMGSEILTTHASHLARKFLIRRGWEVVADEVVVRGSVSLPRTFMHLDFKTARSNSR